MKNTRRLILWIGLPLFILGISIFGIFKSLDDEHFQSLKARVLRGDIRQVIRGVGYLEADELVPMVSHLPGKIEKIEVEAGASVQKGQLLFQVRSPNFQKEYRLIKAKYYQAKLELKKLLSKSSETATLEAQGSLEKAQKLTQTIQKEFSDKTDLFQKGFISKKEMDDTQSRLENAQSEEKIALKRFEDLSKPASKEEVELQQAELAKMKLELEVLNRHWKKRRARASFDALVVEVTKKKGDVVKEDEVVLTLVNTQKPWVVQASVYETDIPKIKKGQKAILKLSGMDGTYQAQVSEISLIAKINGNIRKFPVKLLLQDKIKESVRLGVGAEYEILIEERKNVLMLPLQFIVRKPGGLGVWLLEKKKKKFVPLILGISDENNIEVISGLQEKQEVILLDPYVKEN